MQQRSIMIPLLLVASVGANLIGTTFPHLSGESLDGKKINIPADLEGKRAIVFLTLDNLDSRKSAVEWKKAIVGILGLPNGTKTDNVFLDVMLYDNGFFRKLVQPVVRWRWRANTPENVWPNTVLAYADEAATKKVLNILADEVGHVYLLDRTGTVRYVAAGRLLEIHISRLAAMWQELANEE